MGTFLYSTVWHYRPYALPNPWVPFQIKISPAIKTKGFKTIITNVKFRAFLMGGANSA